MNERRMEGRLLCADLVRVEWGSRVLDGVLEDISQEGACVQTEELIPPAATISIQEIEGRSPVYSGYVAYCVLRDEGYFVGIHFSPKTLWRSRVFEPQHLTDPEVFAEIQPI